jgi:rubrerythrin
MGNLLADTRFAIELEKKGYDFYAETAQRANNLLAISTLSGLAERELLHIERITEFYKSLTGEKSLPIGWFDRVKIVPTKMELLKPIFKKLEKELSRKFESEKSTEKAYQIAEGLERDSYTLYEKIAAESADDIARKFYSALAEEEREHFAILEETLQYLDNPGEWYRKTERWIVEG